MDFEATSEDVKKNVSTSSNESECENVDAIKKYIEEQEKNIVNSEDIANLSESKLDRLMFDEIKKNENQCDSKIFQDKIEVDIFKDKDDKNNSNITKVEINQTNDTNYRTTAKIHMESENNQVKSESMATSTVMDIILSDSDVNIVNTNEIHNTLKEYNSSNENKCIALSVGSKVQARDFGDFWYTAQIIEVDYDEMEVLVHYENNPKNQDEWISVSSTRLRPLTDTAEATISPINMPDIHSHVKEESKTEEKSKLSFVVGERCLARWRDNRRFVATVKKDLGNGCHEIMFDDGFQWICKTSRLCKLKKDYEKREISSAMPPVSSTSPIPSEIPSTSGELSPASLAPIPVFHTHLFDPTRDYLGSKSERREKKRKLNIKEIFNIGQKKYKKHNPPQRRLPIIPAIKKTKVRRKFKTVGKNLSVDHFQRDIPDAVASIIGTASSTINKKGKFEAGYAQDSFNAISRLSFDFDDNTMDPLHDPVNDEEVKLENFEKQTDRTHEAVIDKIKEVITKLEDGIYQAVQEQSSKMESLEVREKKQQIVKEEKQELVKEEKPQLVKEEIHQIDNEEKHQTDNEEKQESVQREMEVETDVKCVEEITDDHKVKLDMEPDKENNILEKSEIVSNSTGEISKKNLTKIKKGKKLRMLREKKVKLQVEKVKSELEAMKKQVEEMRQQMLIKTEELARHPQKLEMPESFLLPGEWCAKWVNGQPVGTVVELDGEVKADSDGNPGLPRRSVQVEDKRLPPGWTKHMVRRSMGHTAGKWDIVLISPDNYKLHTKTEMQQYLMKNTSSKKDWKPYEAALMDFGIHMKLSRRMGWYTTTEGGTDESRVIHVSANNVSSTSPLVKSKSKKFSLKRKLESSLVQSSKKKKRRLIEQQFAMMSEPRQDTVTETEHAPPPLEDGYVYVGSLKVQVIDTLLRCPAEGCYKNFRNNTLIKMHIKHYHRDLKKQLGSTPKVLDLAYARAKPTADMIKKTKHSKGSKRIAEPASTPTSEPKVRSSSITNAVHDLLTPNDLPSKPVKRPKVLLPVRRPEEKNETVFNENDHHILQPIAPVKEVPNLDTLDFETAISTHTVTKPLGDIKKKGMKKKGLQNVPSRPISEDDDWFGVNSDMDTRSSCPRSGTPDSKTLDSKADSLMNPMSSESNDDRKDSNMYTYNESGDRIKIVHMKREEIINCHCGFREEDGLMVQCELCLCWQHAFCQNIQSESEVPEKYTCSICLKPRRGRKSARFLHDQDRLYEGTLPNAKPCPVLRRSHELTGNLLRIQDALHALRVKYYVATKKDHPKLYLWAKDWESGEIALTQEKLHSDYSDLNIMLSNTDKENMPVKPDDIKDLSMELRTPPAEEQESHNKDVSFGSQTLLSGLLSSPGAASLDLPISTSELEKLAKSVQVCEEKAEGAQSGPQPEAAIENTACRERLLRHIQRCQALIDARLDSIEAQVAELESQDPSFEDDETADFYPRTKQTIQMLLQDLSAMEQLEIVT